MKHRHILKWSNIERVIFCEDIGCDYVVDATQILDIVKKSSSPTKRARDVCPSCDDTGYRRVSPTILAKCSCKHPAQTFAEPPIEDNGFGLADASEFFACLATAENFGCVRHEGKDQ